MKKQTISKIAAIALAAMTVVPMFGVTASADITFSNGNDNNGNFMQAYGTANQLKWQLISTTTTPYKIEVDTAKSTADYNQYKLVVDKTAGGETTKTYVQDDKSVEENIHVDNANTKANFAAYGNDFYAWKKSIPEDDNAKTILEKAKKNNADDLQKYQTALTNWNNNIKNYYSAKSRVVTASNGKTEAVWQSFTAYGNTYWIKATGGVFDSTIYKDNKGTETVMISIDSYSNPNTNAPKLSDETTPVALTTSSTFTIYTYNFTATLGDASMTTVVSNLGGLYITMDPTTGKLTSSNNEDGFKIINGGEVVPIPNPDGSSSSGTAKPGNTTTTPGTTIYTDYSLTPTATYCWYSTAYPGRYYRDGYTAQMAAYALTGNYGTAVKANVATSIDYRTSVSAEYPYVSSVPNRYYKTAADAVQDAKNNGYTNPTAVNYYTNYYNNPYGYLYGYNYGYGTTTAVKDTSNVTIGNYKGWTYVTRTINSARAGASYTVKMNTETEIPSNVLKALYGKNVTVNFKFNSGATLSIKGTDMVSTSAINTNIRYVKNVPSALVKKAVKSNSGVSSAQFSVSGGSLGSTASVTVKFNTNRSGCTATLYRYNASANSLSKVSTSTVKSNGYCTLGNVAQGGEYVIVLS